MVSNVESITESAKKREREKMIKRDWMENARIKSIIFYLTVPVRVIWAVEGKDVDLPCDITTTTPGDYPKLILWFKDTTGIPLYRYSIDHQH